MDELAGLLGQAGQQLSLDVPAAPDGAGRGTVGGVLATAAAGPRRLRYGTPRDLSIGITVVLADGTVAHSGGKVVKNVAGYDIGKLFAGSLGTLGLIVEAAFRLHPVPAATAFVDARLRRRDGGAAGAGRRGGLAARARPRRKSTGPPAGPRCECRCCSRATTPAWPSARPGCGTCSAATRGLGQPAVLVGPHRRAGRPGRRRLRPGGPAGGPARTARCCGSRSGRRNWPRCCCAGCGGPRGRAGSLRRRVGGGRRLCASVPGGAAAGRSLTWSRRCGRRRRWVRGAGCRCRAAGPRQRGRAARAAGGP